MLLKADDGTPTAEELLDALPYGVVVVASDGAIKRANAAAIGLVPSLVTDAVQSCGDLFSCRSRGGPCERGCLVARAAGSSKPAPEVRIDAVGGAFPGAMWVTASPLPDGRGAILHLRSGWRGDRRRRSEESWKSEPELRIRAFGRTQVDALEDTLASDWLSQRPGQILKYLVCERGRTVMVDEIAEAIWPDSGSLAVNNTRYSIHRLRTKLEPRRAAHDPPAFVVASGGGYALDRERIWIDADEFEQAVEQGRAAMVRLAQAAATEQLERAVGLYHGAFLADEPYAHWVTNERNRLASLAIYALRVLTALAHKRNDGPDAIRHLLRISELEPLDSGVHRELVQALLGDGQRSHAKRHYEAFASRLRHELGEEPDFDLRSEQARVARSA